ncbi:hypothetical protein M3Y99_01840200 [Aphelenchoides fujianensis]|nr:hypothetical protein M3Y99_01840200 [Aphelenchoides fujianensis]
MLAVAWIAAVFISAPQFAVWRSYEAFKKHKWSKTQCMQTWEISRAEAVFKNNTQINANELMREENLYVMIHMALIFYIPLALIMLSYIIVSVWVWLNSAPSLLMNGRARLGERPWPANPKILITDELQRPLNCETRASSATSADILRHNSTSKVISSAMRRSHSTFSARVNRNRAIRVSFLLIMAYVICWLPYNVISAVQFFDSEIFNKHAASLYCLHVLMVANSVVNPFLYGLFGKNCLSKTKRYS